MAGWQGWVAAVGGLLAIIDIFTATSGQWLTWVGGIVAILAGVWSAYA